MELFKLLGTIAIESNGAVAAIDDTNKHAGQLSENLKKGIETVGKWGIAIATAAAGAATALGTAAIKNASVYEDSFAKVSTLLDSSSTDMDSYKQDILDASAEANVGANEFAEAVYQAISASVDQGKAVEFAAQAAKLAKGGFTDTATAVDVLTTAINAYGLSADDAGKLADMLITTQNKGKTTVGELASAMGKVIPTAKTFGIEMDELCGYYATMTANGIATAESTTYLNSMINELGKGSETLGTYMSEATEAVLGEEKSYKELRAEGMSTLDVLNLLGKYADSTGTSVIQMFSSAEAGKAATVLASNSANVTQNIKAMNDSAGSTAEAYEKMENTLSAEASKIKNSFLNIIIEMGNNMLPIVKKLCDYVTKQLPKIRQLFQKLSPVITKMLESIEPLLEGFASKLLPTIFDAMSKILPVLSNMAEKLLPVVARVMSTVADLFADFLPVVAKIAEKVLPIFATIFETVAGLFERISPVIKNIVDVLLPPFEVLLSGLSTAIGWVCDGISGILDVLGLRHESLTQEQQDSQARCEAAKEEAEKYRETRDAVQEARDAAYDKAAADMEATAKVEDLWNELQTLCDESGNVKEADKTRAEFILNELNTALGTEYTMTGNQIKNYQEMQAEIDKVIEKKRAEILLTAAEENYRNAIQNQAAAQADMVNALKAVEEQQQRINDYKQEQIDLEDEWLELLYKAQDANQTLTIEEQERLKQYYNEIEPRQVELEKLIAKETEALEEMSGAYSDAAATVQGYNNDIAKYETAAGLVLEDKTTEAIKLLDKRGEAYLKASQIYGEATAAQMAQLEQQVIDAGVQYEILKQQMDNCADYEKAYYEEELRKAQDHFEDMHNEYVLAGGDASRSFTAEINKTMFAYYGTNGTASYHGTMLGDSISKGIKDSEAGMRRTLSGAFRGSLENAGKENEETARSVGANLAAGVRRGIETVKDSMLDAGRHIIDYVNSGAKKRAQINSPSRLFAREVGEQLPAGVGVGIRDNKEAAIEPMYELMEDMVPSTPSIYEIVGQVPAAYGGAVPTVMTGAVPAAPSNADVIAKLNELIAVMSRQRIYLDSGALVGGMAADMNEALGVLAVEAERGR